MNFSNKLIPSLAVFSLVFLLGVVNTATAQSQQSLEELEQIFAETLEEVELERKVEEKKETIQETRQVVQEDTATPDVAERGQHCTEVSPGSFQCE